MKTVLITGDRNWTNKEIIKQSILSHKLSIQNTKIIQGGCKRNIKGSYVGADYLGEQVATELGFKNQQTFPAEWNSYGLTAGPKRNLQCRKNFLKMILYLFFTMI